jgi:hypothetical protein
MILGSSKKLMDLICKVVEPNSTWKVENSSFNGRFNARQSLENRWLISCSILDH